MQYPSGCGNVDESMKKSPAFSTKPLNHVVSRGNCQRNHEKERNHSYQNEWSLSYVFTDANEIEQPVEPNVGEQMKCAVEERKKSEHTTKLHERIRAESFSKGRYR